MTSTPSPAEPTQPAETTPPPAITRSLIPIPASITWGEESFTLSAETAIYVQPYTDELTAIGGYLADNLKRATGYPLEVKAAESELPAGSILLTTEGGDPSLGEEGYTLTVTANAVTLSAAHPSGIFRGVQTIRQLLPPQIESETQQSETWIMPVVSIRDEPRYAWRGMMLDVSRHFFSVEDVKRVIDLAAYAKLNRFHLHLSDDQGWRIEIKSWPNLTEHGGSTEVGGGEGGYYTQADYANIVAYAQARYITIIPEIDMPGHTNAALASYAELNCDGVATDLYTGIEVGFSSLCIEKGGTYEFLDDVIGELAAMTPGAYIHIGGDEARATPKEDYIAFIEQVQAIVQSHGKTMIGWEEIIQSKLHDSTIIQYWDTREEAQAAAAQGIQIIMSPAPRAYLDMKYEQGSPLGLHWAGFISVEHGYTWDPAAQTDGISEAAILGVEAPLWSETISTIDELEYLAFPRLLGYAEIGWSPQSARDWEDYRLRLAEFGARLRILGIDFYEAPEIDWK